MLKERFTFLCDRQERQLLATVAKQLRRSQSDTIRLLIHEAAREVGSAPDQAHAGQGDPHPTTTEVDHDRNP